MKKNDDAQDRAASKDKTYKTYITISWSTASTSSSLSVQKRTDQTFVSAGCLSCQRRPEGQPVGCFVRQPLKQNQRAHWYPACSVTPGHRASPHLLGSHVPTCPASLSLSDCSLSDVSHMQSTNGSIAACAVIRGHRAGPIFRGVIAVVYSFAHGL